MPWIVLIVSAVLEAVWATALGASNGFTELVPSIVFFAALVASVVGLKLLKSSPASPSEAPASAVDLLER